MDLDLEEIPDFCSTPGAQRSQLKVPPNPNHSMKYSGLRAGGDLLQCPPLSLFWQHLPGLGMFRFGRRVGPAQLSQLCLRVCFVFPTALGESWGSREWGICCLHVKPDLARGLPCCFSWEEEDLWPLCGIWVPGGLHKPQQAASDSLHWECALERSESCH